jgi:hypothetical protein
MDLPVTPEITWPDFVNLEPVRQLLARHPSMRLQDVTPDGMPDWFTDEDWLKLQQEKFKHTDSHMIYIDELDT